MANKRELVKFLDSRVFNFIREASADNYSERDQDRLEDVRKRTRSEKDRFRHYRNAKEVIDNCRNDLHSSAAKKVNHNLEKLRLPTLPSSKDECP